MERETPPHQSFADADERRPAVRSEADPARLDGRDRAAGAAAPLSAGGAQPAPDRTPVAAGWLTWQAALYVLALGVACLFVIPLTDLWWIIPVLGAAAPIALAVLNGRHHRSGVLAAERGPERPRPGPISVGEPVDRAGAATVAPPALAGNEAPRKLPEPARADLVAATDRDATAGDPGEPTTPVAGDAHRPPTAQTPTAPAPLEEPLSEREIEVLASLASGKTTAEAARDLFVSPGTIKSHTGNIYRKLGVRNRTEAIARARDLGLLP